MTCIGKSCQDYLSNAYQHNICYNKADRTYVVLYISNFFIVGDAAQF